VSRELVTVTKNGRQVVRVSQEPVDMKVAEAGKEPDPKTVPEVKKPPRPNRGPMPPEKK